MITVFIFIPLPQLSRGFNDAINGFSDDGWSVMNCDGSEDVVVAVNAAKNLVSTSDLSSSLSLVGGVLCAKASMLLQVSHSDTNAETLFALILMTMGHPRDYACSW